MVEQLASDDTLLPSESTVLEALASANTQWTQRELAHKTGYSIGLINTILKKLSKTGYIKVSNINRRRLQYLLTPQGFAVTSKVAYNYIARTFQDYQRLYFQISLFFKELSIQGRRDLYVHCDDADLNNLVQVVMRESASESGIRFHEVPLGGVTTVCLKGATVTPAGPVLDLSLQSDELRSL
jgi:DNA-binding MarR family transcriptional regulator